MLIDTHALLWMALGDEKLSVPARTLMDDRSNVGLVSPASYWEIAIKVGLGKYSLSRPFEGFFQDALTANRFSVLPIAVSHAAALSSQPLHHRDPFDRMLIAQAIVENVPLVSADAAFEAYPIRRLW